MRSEHAAGYGVIPLLVMVGALAIAITSQEDGEVERRKSPRLVPAGKPTPDREGRYWDYLEMTDHLRSQGLRFDAGKCVNDQLPFTGDPTDTLRGAYLFNDARTPVRINVIVHGLVGYVQDRVGYDETRSYVWGRFEFRYPKNPTVNELEQRDRLHLIRAALQ